MIRAEYIKDFINSIAPFDAAMSFDNVGLLIGSPAARADRVLLALDATAAVLHEAAQKGASVVVTHHPVIFHPIKSMHSDSVPYLAARLGITVISAHTNLDIAPGGVNDTLARAVGVIPDGPTDAECTLTGTLPEPMDCQTLALHIRQALCLPGLRFTENDRPLRRVMVACGAGGSSVGSAIARGADALITGEIKHHEILQAADAGLAVFDLGHFGSEKLIVPRLKELLQQQFPDTVFEQAEADTDGIRFCV